MALTSRFIVSNVDMDKDWDELFATYWDSWKQPLQAVGQLTFVGIGEGGQQEADSFAKNKEAYLAAARANPSQMWRKVEDVTLQQQGLPAIVGGGAFTQCRSLATSGQDQHQDSEIKLPGPNYPPGSERHGLVQEFYSQMWGWRAKWMQKPHSCRYPSPPPCASLSLSIRGCISANMLILLWSLRWQCTLDFTRIPPTWCRKASFGQLAK